MKAETPVRTYEIKGGQGYFDAGTIPCGDQILMGIQLPDLIAVRFSPAGKLVSVDSRALRAPDESVAQDELRIWQDQLGFHRSKIQVQAFFLEDRMIGIRDLPDHYQDVLDHPDDFDIERRVNLENDAKAWLERGDFVLFWDEDYYLNREGDVESS